MVRVNRLVPLFGLATVLLLAACSSTEDVTAPPTPTTAPVQQPLPGATAMPGAPAAPAATAMPGATATPRPTVAPADQAKFGGIALFSHRADPSSWDPMFSGTISLVNVIGGIYGDGNVVKPCREDVFSVCPGLASSWDVNNDFTEWTFTIRDNVVWHDGQPFTADDVKFWIELALNGAEPNRRSSGGISGRLSGVVSVEAPSNTTLKITLGSSQTFFLDSLGDGSGRIAHPKHLAQPEIDKGNATVAPPDMGYVGTGPFAFEQYRRGSVFRVRKFDRYWEQDELGRQLPYMDGIDFPIIGDTNTMTAAFRSGRIDKTARGGGFDLSPQQMEAILKDMGPEKVYFRGWQSTAEGLAPNSRKPPWDDVRVRKALFLWLDRDAGCIAVLGGNCTVVPLMPLNSPWLNPDFLEWPGFNPATKEQDRAEAKRLLADAGFPNGFKTVVMCRAAWVFFCEFGEQQLRGLLGEGNVSLDVVDDATRDERLCSGNFEVNLHGGLGGDQFPETIASSMITTNECANVKHDDTHVDDLFAKLSQVQTLEERIKVAREIERYVTLENAYFSQFWKPVKNIGIRTYVKGFFAPAVGQGNNLDHATIWLDK